ncbi:NAD-dependent epimerase/dehydratase family protein [Streptomyces sp. NPDC050504]|uniref:NAD-dependent epimerase/dehydratase family protein n=1 Tax=Streptomyces sp. NPDC050504 TaxID=3365618 RepID=UPI0037B57ECE
MRVLVLGATGFLGGHVAAQLRALLGVRLLAGGRSPAADVPLDLTADPDTLADALFSAAPDAVVNCAGLVAGTAVALTDVNARGPAALCEALRESVPTARLVHIGSAAEYGPTPAGVSVAETAPTRPQGPYGATKLAGTVAVTSSGSGAVVLRVFSPVGPGAPVAGLPGRLAAELRGAGGGTARVGDLSAYRDFIDVRDVARAAVLAATLPAPLPPVLNVGSGQATPVRDLAHGLVLAAGSAGRFEETPGGGPAGPDAVSWQCADTTVARAALGWEPRYTLAESLAGLWAAAAPASAVR